MILSRSMRAIVWLLVFNDIVSMTPQNLSAVLSDVTAYDKLSPVVTLHQ